MFDQSNMPQSLRQIKCDILNSNQILTWKPHPIQAVLNLRYRMSQKTTRQTILFDSNEQKETTQPQHPQSGHRDLNCTLQLRAPIFPILQNRYPILPIENPSPIVATPFYVSNGSIHTDLLEIAQFLYTKISFHSFLTLQPTSHKQPVLNQSTLKCFPKAETSCHLNV